MIDVHCHLAFPGLFEISDKVVADARNSMEFVVTCGLSRDYGKTFEIAEKNSDFVFVSLGIHPEDVINMSDDDIQRNLEFIRNKADKIVAIGEVGLDYGWVKESQQIERCKIVFEKCLDIAEELNLPVVLHSRKAEEDVFNIISQRKTVHVVFHHYSGNMTLAKEILEKGYYISMPTTLHHSKTLQKIAKSFPLENLLTETDSPFNSPTADKINVPQNVSYTLKFIEKLRNEKFEKIDAVTTRNAKKIFNL